MDTGKALRNFPLSISFNEYVTNKQISKSQNSISALDCFLTTKIMEKPMDKYFKLKFETQFKNKSERNTKCYRTLLLLCLYIIKGHQDVLCLFQTVCFMKGEIIFNFFLYCLPSVQHNTGYSMGAQKIFWIKKNGKNWISNSLFETTGRNLTVVYPYLILLQRIFISSPTKIEVIRKLSLY